MFLRFILLTTLFTLGLLAAPNIRDLKAAVAKDPSLLNTPQAKALMKEKGVSVNDVKSRLEKNNELTAEVVDENNIENKIITEDTEDTEDTQKKKISKRLNPFSYKTSKELRKELNQKKELLVKNKLSRYSDAYYANQNIIDSASLPTPDDYILSSGDIIDLYIYGDRDAKQILKIQNDGSVELEFIGPVTIGSMSYKDAKKHLKRKLKHHFKNSSFKIVVSKYSSIQVTLIGDVKYPGIYNLSSFSSAKDLLIASKGIRPSASVRDIVIKRGGKIVANLDSYELFFNGENIGTTLLKHGDIVIVKKADKLVSIDGFVNHSAIYELTKDENLDAIIEYAGGMQANASKHYIKVQRYNENSTFKTFNISYKEAKDFKVENGDKVYIYAIDISSDKNINVYGNVIRAGSYGIKESASLSNFFKINIKHGLKEFFLPETYFAYGTIKRYGKSLNYETISFNVKEVINGIKDIKIYPKDELYIFNKNDLYSSSYVTTKGTILVHSGKLSYFDGMTIKDAVNASGIDGIIDDKIRVTTLNTPNRMPKTSFYSYKKDSELILSPYDEIELYDYYETHLLEPISIKGEVINPTTVFYEKGMRLKDLFSACGGFTQKAYLNKLEIVRYFVNADNSRESEIIYLNLENIKNATYELNAYDEVTIYKIPNWNDKKVVTLKGEVKFPGTYTVKSGEKLSSVIERAGGFTDEAFVNGTVFTRESIKENQLAQYNASLAKIKRELSLLNAMPANAKNATVGASSVSSLNDVILEAKKYQPIGRVSIVLENNLESFKNSQYDLILKNKDTITIPDQIDTVTVFGEVFNPTSFVFREGKSAEFYIELASGLSRSADDSNIYVIHADGTSEPLSNGFFSSEVIVSKGDTIVVPIYVKEINNIDLWDSVARVVSSFAITAAAFNTLGVF